MSFVQQDLGMSQDALDQITAQLANANNPDPIGDAIARQLQKVADYTLRYAVPDERVKRLTRILALWDIYSNPALGPMPPNVAAAYKDAMQELEDIRDGKFKDLKQQDPPSPDLAKALGQTGGDPFVDFSRGDGTN